MEDTTIENALKTFEDHYLKKEYSKALSVLEKNQNEIDSGVWHYNMGTLMAEMNNWSMARFHFLSAEVKGFDSENLFQNQRIVEEKLEISKLEKALNTSDYLVKAGLFASQGLLTSLSLIFLVTGLLIFRKRLTYKSLGMVFFVMIFPLACDFWISTWPFKIVAEKKAIYEGPSALFPIREELPAGILILTKNKNDWEEIIYPSRFSGWIKPDGMKELELR